MFGIAGVLLGPLFLCSAVELVKFGAVSLRPENRAVMTTPLAVQRPQTPLRNDCLNYEAVYLVAGRDSQTFSPQIRRSPKIIFSCRENVLGRYF